VVSITSTCMSMLLNLLDREKSLHYLNQQSSCWVVSSVSPALWLYKHGVLHTG
jgi:hypothetical protein